MAYRRTALKQFSTANEAYASAVVHFYEVDASTNESSGTLATVYDNVAGTGTLANPYTLDAYGKSSQPLYFDTPVIALIDQADVPDHETGIIWPQGGDYKGDWASVVFYTPGDVIKDAAAGAGTENIYICTTAHTSGTWATDLSNSYWDLFIDASSISGYATAAAASAAAASSSETNASTSESNASTSASNASTSESNASTSASNASTSETNAATSASSLSDFRHFESAGSSNAYTGDLTPDATLTDGAVFRFKANFTNTGSATMNIDGTGAKTMKKFFDTNLSSGDIEDGGMYWITYDSDNDTFQVLTTIAQAAVGNMGDLSDVTITSIASGEVIVYTGSIYENQTLAEAGIAAASHNHAASEITSGTFTDARVAASNVTQHEAALTITEAQVSDLGAYITASSTETLTNKTIDAGEFNGAVSGTSILDEDDMSTDSNARLATQQSIKAYVDSQIGNIHPGFIAAEYYTCPAIVTSGSGAISANRLYATPFFVPKTTTFDRIAINIATGSGGDSGRFGIYENENGAPTDLVADLGTISVASTGLTALTISQALSPGWYWLGFVSDGTPSVTKADPGGLANILPMTANASCKPISGTHAYAALPDPFPTLIISSGGIMLEMQLRAS